MEEQSGRDAAWGGLAGRVRCVLSGVEEEMGVSEAAMGGCRRGSRTAGKGSEEVVRVERSRGREDGHYRAFTRS